MKNLTLAWILALTMMLSCGTKKTETASETEVQSEEVMTVDESMEDLSSDEVEALEEEAAVVDSLSTEIEESSQALDEALDQLEN